MDIEIKKGNKDNNNYNTNTSFMVEKALNESCEKDMCQSFGSGLIHFRH